MTDLQELFRTIDSLSNEEFDQLRAYVEKRNRIVKWWIVPPENIERIFEIMRPVQEEAAQMSEEEVNAAIDEAIAEVRRERRKNQSDT
jgi:hypothetical protein